MNATTAATSASANMRPGHLQPARQPVSLTYIQQLILVKHPLFAESISSMPEDYFACHSQLQPWAVSVVSAMHSRHDSLKGAVPKQIEPAISLLTPYACQPDQVMRGTPSGAARRLSMTVPSQNVAKSELLRT